VQVSDKAIVVAIDGPSGSGKSSVSKGVARRLGLRYLDTGAQYRAMTWWMLRNDIDVADPRAVAAARTALPSSAVDRSAHAGNSPASYLARNQRRHSAPHRACP